MMRRLNMDLSTWVSRDELLDKLRANLTAHKKIVQEAVTGYIAAAHKELAHRLDQLEAGKVVALTFTLQPPQDMSEAYKTVIGMLEMSQDDKIELSVSEYRQLVMDEWDWMDQFLVSNSRYSKLAEFGAGAKGLL